MALVLSAAGASLPSTPLLAQTRPAAAPAESANPALDGFWAPRPLEAAPAALTPKFKAMSAIAANLAPGITQEHAERWCVHRGLPSQMATSGTIDIIVGKGMIGVAFMVPGAQRYIYTDGRKRPSSEVLDGTTNGFSIGRWETGVLVVDTAAFANTGVRAIPGGGWRGETSRLTERFALSEDGKMLTVTSTWSDPKVFAKPHSYSIIYDRVPSSFSANEKYCDAVVPARMAPTYVGEY
ncbi:MAG: hypothetical protein KF730_03295 [Sphingomonas sp.]|uniref:hypothetical protein n=1 Tax=Sphingomonas sp. TaxID=28214 RepID=UPI0025D26024|nr:hypothetical protein [Sphingomonas sp.]MBX3563583.1 hypothetical protein [Sphingomonas sp.]